MAIGAMWQAKKMGLTLPDDLSFVGFDNLEQAKYTLPALTTVNQPRAEIGHHAMQLLLEQIHGNNVTPGSRLLDSDLIIRESTKAPKS